VSFIYPENIIAFTRRYSLISHVKYTAKALSAFANHRGGAPVLVNRKVIKGEH
jgi:hypothetical protein